ncbi:Urb2/Npa2 family-domain-containing protein [Naematelia encephala]|uniref:Urb2/Npa2 family-domain-containing protein n=1 Tax=Naematelia encephala TaxID=71784 RepID=A0A1Y2B970_9TREE|nr:Urb2/Npa2 family-domain-containing protein [Naematelia encephala]
MQAANTAEGYLSSASSFIKALKSSNDPPCPDWPEKVDIARHAWATLDLYVPKKAEVIGEWIIEAWSRQNLLLADERYHSLLLDVWAPSANSRPPLSILAAFFSVANASNEYDIAAKSLTSMFSEVDAFKAEAWVEVWAAMLASKCRRQELIDLAVKGFNESMSTSPNSRKLALNLLPFISMLAKAKSESMVTKSIRSLILPLMPDIQPFLEALKPIDAVSQAFLPTLLDSYVHILQDKRYELFSQPSSSRVGFDIFVKDKERVAVRNATSSILSVLHNDAWGVRCDVWRLIEAWGGFLETDAAWYEMVETSAKQAAQSLQGSRSARDILNLLDVLERLCHSAATIGTDTIGWCLASSTACRIESRRLLSSILQYHRLAHTLPTWFSLLGMTLDTLFPDNLSEDSARLIYSTVDAGPLFDRRFRQDMVRSVRHARRGRQEIVHICLQQIMRHTDTASKAASFAIHGQLLALIMHDGPPVEEFANGVLALPHAKRRKLDWSSDLVEYTRLTLARTLASVDESTLSLIDISQTHLNNRSSRLVMEYVSHRRQSSSHQLLLETRKSTMAPPQAEFVPTLIKSVKEPHVWDLVSERGLAVLDAIAQPQDLETFWKLVAASDVPERLLSSAEIWELPRLRHALDTMLLEVDSVALLCSIPIRVLTPSLKAKLIRWATKRDKRSPEDRIVIRQWLGQIGVTDLKYLRRLVETPLDDSTLVETTMELLKSSFLLIPLDDLLGIRDVFLAETSTFNGNLGYRAAFVFCEVFTKCSVSPDAVEDLAKHLIQSYSNRIELAVTRGELPEIWWIKGCLTLRALKFRVQLTPPRLGGQIAALLVKHPDSETAPHVLLLLRDEVFPPIQILSLYLSLTKMIPSRTLDLAMRDVVRRFSTSEYKAVFEAMMAFDAPREALHILLRASVKGSGNIVSQFVPDLILNMDLEVIKSLIEQRSRNLHQHDFPLLWSAIHEVLLPRPKQRPLSSELFGSIIEILTIVIRNRADLVRLTLPGLVDCIRALFPAFQRPTPTTRLTSSWLLSIEDAEVSAENFSRLLSTLASMECASLAKHVTPILLAYVQAVANSSARIEQKIRIQLEPGVFALCEVVAKGGKMTARGREGEGIGMPYGLGDGGDGEKQVWAELWTEWSRKRYSGRG